MEIDIQTGRQTGRQTDRETYRQTYRQTDGQTDRQTDKLHVETFSPDFKKVGNLREDNF